MSEEKKSRFGGNLLKVAFPLVVILLPLALSVIGVHVAPPSRL
jgi:hypothetical protein